MAKINVLRRLIVVQILLIALTSILPLEVDGAFWNSVARATGSMARTITRSTSNAMDKSQSATQKMASYVRKVKPLKPVTDATGSAISNVFGTASRLLGKSIGQRNDVIFLYSRPAEFKNYTKDQVDAANTVIGYALTNVILHMGDMDGKKKTSEELPVLESLVEELSAAGTDQKLIDNVKKIFGRNGHCDLPIQIKNEFDNVMDHADKESKNNDLLEDINWIAENPKGFYKMNDGEVTGYKLKTKKRFRRCVVIRPIKFENTKTN